jgi:hypothetical protein
LGRFQRPYYLSIVFVRNFEVVWTVITDTSSPCTDFDESGTGDIALYYNACEGAWYVRERAVRHFDSATSVLNLSAGPV